MMDLFMIHGEFLLASSWWSWNWITSGLTSQEGVVRFCALCAALGLYILLRK